MTTSDSSAQRLRTGWATGLAVCSLVSLVFLTITGLVITFAAFHAAVQWTVLIHTAAGLVTLLLLVWYSLAHWKDYRDLPMSQVVLLGWVAAAALLVVSVSGLVVTVQALFGVTTSWLWRQIHLVSTFVMIATFLPHAVIPLARLVRQARAAPAWRAIGVSVAGTVIGALLIAGFSMGYGGTEYENTFPEDYSYLYGEDTPFRPSLARTDTGGAFDSRSLSGSESCGTAGCHREILEEWTPSAHRYAAMDVLFQGVQKVMAEQNGPESTRYCGGCHDPISLFSGAKNLFAEDLTNLAGYNEGVSCLACHAIRETDLQGNANYVVTQPAEYLWQWEDEGPRRVVRDFLIRSYPSEHNRLSKRMFKTPEYCAACHKQFIDEEINRVGWVQLQNQYDNWKASRWNHPREPEKTVECRECHMPLVASNDPASGDDADYNRSDGDGKHRSHRFLASNGLMPAMLELEGWEKQVELTDRWLRGDLEVPEIMDKWASGPIVSVALEAPETIEPGESIPLRVVMTSNKVGHDYPTGPLDIIQSWLEVRVTDDQGREIFASGTRDENHFIEPGSFLFKAEPVDQHGNLIDRHNLWEMVGVRFRRALFPGYSDTVQYTIPCEPALGAMEKGGNWEGDHALDIPSPAEPGTYRIVASLQYRKVDQYLLNFLLGEDSGHTAPVTEVARGEVSVRVAGRQASLRPGPAAP